MKFILYAVVLLVLACGCAHANSMFMFDVGQGAAGGGGVTPVTPDQVPGLSLWLKADAAVFSDAGTTPATNGQTVEQWNDQSGNSNNATQVTSGNRPTYVTGALNSLPGIQFTSASSTYLINSYNSATPVTAFVVYSSTMTSADNVPNNRELVLLGGVDGSNNFAYGLKAGTQADGNGNSSAAWIVQNTGGTNFTSSLSVQFNVSDLLAVQGGGSAGGTVYRQGISSQAPTSASGTLRTPSTAHIGHTPGSSIYYNGFIHEIVVYNTTLTTSQYAAVLLGLQNKWGLNTYSGGYYSAGEMIGGSGHSYTLYLMQSSDAVNWKWRPTNIVANTATLSGASSLQNPALLLATQSINTGGLNWLVTANYPKNGTDTSNTFDVYSSPDLMQWTYRVSMSGASFTGTGASAAAVNPSWFVDVDGSVHVIGVLYNGTNWQISEFHPLTANNLGGSWSTQSANLNPNTQPFNMNAPSIYQVSGTYYNFYTHPQDIALAESSSPFSGYTSTMTSGFGSWATNLGGNSIESSYFLQKGSTYYGYIFDITALNTKYSTTASAFPGTAWTTPVAIGTNMLNGSVIYDAVFTQSAPLTPVVTPYNGPADVVASPKAWWGVRAMSNADLGNRLINICEPTNTTCIDWSSNPTSGKLVAQSVGGTDCTAVNTCTIKTFYDRSGANSCGGPCDITQATAAQRGTLTWNCLNSLPCVVLSGSQSGWANATGFTQAQPLTISLMWERTSASNAGYIWYGSGTADIQTRSAVANAFQMFAGTTAQFIGNITDNNFHSLQAIFTGASSVLFCGGSAGTNCSTGGTANSISPGTNSFVGVSIGSNAGTAPVQGNFSEIGMWPVAFSSTQRSNMAANQAAFYGAF